MAAQCRRRVRIAGRTAVYYASMGMTSWTSLLDKLQIRESQIMQLTAEALLKTKCNHR